MIAPEGAAADTVSAAEKALSARASAATSGVARSTDKTNPAPEIVAGRRERSRYLELLIAETALVPVQRLVGVRLALFMNTDNGQLNPSYATLGAACGMSERSAKRHVAALVEAGWVIRKTSRGRVANAYELAIPTVT